MQYCFFRNTGYRMTVSFSLVTKVCIIPGENEEWFECSCVFNLLLVKKDAISQA